MAPLRSIAGRSLGKLLEGFKTSTLGQGFGSDCDCTFAATGGNTTLFNGYKYHVFTFPNSDNFEVTQGYNNVEYLVVGGGGGGASRNISVDTAGGGGAGGLRTNAGPSGGGGAQEAAFLVSPGTYLVTVGNGASGGTAGDGTAANGGRGDSSYFGPPSTPEGITSQGGGGGAGNSIPSFPDGNIKNGGSGGGSRYGDDPAGLGNRDTSGNPVTSQGYPGGLPNSDPGTNGGGGGGAGGAGGAGSNPSPGPGGNGWPVSAFGAPIVGPLIPAPQQSAFNSAVGPTGLYAGGGGGDGLDSGAGTGGPGGGGSGNQGSGVFGTGGGGGANWPGTVGGNGGAGIVIIRYQV